MKINLRDVETTSFEPIPSGRYEVTIDDVSLVSSSTGKPMIKLRYKVVEGTEKGRMIFDQIVLVQTAYWKLKTILQAIDSDLVTSSDTNENKIVEELQNKRLSVHVEIGKNDQGQTTFQCSNWTPALNTDKGRKLFE